MRVLITAKAGYFNPRRGIAAQPGQTADVSDDLAVKLLNAGLAVPAPAPEPLTAAAAPPENTAKRVSKPKPKSRKQEVDRDRNEASE